MKVLKRTIITIFSLGLIAGAGYLYASNGVKSKPERVTLKLPNRELRDTIIAINLGPEGIKPAQWLLKQVNKQSDNQLDAPERVFMSVLQELQGVQLRIYDVKDNRGAYEQAINGSVAALKTRGWQSLFTVREDKQHTVVMQSGNSRHIDGLSIMASSTDFVVILNLIGPFDLESLTHTVSQLE